jgi:HAMP domain-containing protein
MRLTRRGFLWFIGIGLYVMCLGGIFYFNLFKWTFDEKLKQDIKGSVQSYAHLMINGLLKSPQAITFEEFDILQSLAKDERVVSVIYLDRAGKIRWHKDSRFIGKPWDEYAKEIPPLTKALNQAFMAKRAIAFRVPKEPFYEIGFPFTVRGELIGILDIVISKAEADALIGSAMLKYVIGATGVLLLLGLPLFFFFSRYVVTPLSALRDSVETISLKSFDLRFPAKEDEIGDLADSISRLLGKMKTDTDGNIGRDHKYKEGEQRWWRSVLDTAVPRTENVIVVDENNAILYANFELAGGMDTKNLHLLDVVDNQQQNLLRLVARAFDAPNQPVEGETVFRGQNKNVRILHVGGADELKRTLIILSPKPE